MCFINKLFKRVLDLQNCCVQSAYLFLLYRILEILVEINAEWVVLVMKGGREGASGVDGREAGLHILCEKNLGIFCDVILIYVTFQKIKKKKTP